ncbi:MAG: hypothetical protein IMX02_08000 [Limnochordaceae bacterium]|nr:hypothetical protein [Limnochordaceae bacterium]
MRKKIATTLDPELYARAREQAQREGRRFNELLERALSAYLEGATRRRSVVQQTWGVFRVPPEFVREATEAQIYGDAD